MQQFVGKAATGTYALPAIVEKILKIALALSASCIVKCLQIPFFVEGWKVESSCLTH
jgi:hypothetical protein